MAGCSLITQSSTQDFAPMTIRTKISAYSLYSGLSRRQDLPVNNLFRNLMSDSANTARDRATWEGASMVERATFGRVFNFISGILALIFIVGCVVISGATKNSQILTYVCGIVWLIPFIFVGMLLARFRHSLFVR